MFQLWRRRALWRRLHSARRLHCDGAVHCDGTVHCDVSVILTPSYKCQDLVTSLNYLLAVCHTSTHSNIHQTIWDVCSLCTGRYKVLVLTNYNHQTQLQATLPDHWPQRHWSTTDLLMKTCWTCRNEKPIATPPIIRKLLCMNDDNWAKQPYIQHS